jgi:hypothetical protein
VKNYYKTKTKIEMEARDVSENECKEVKIEEDPHLTTLLPDFDDSKNVVTKPPVEVKSLELLENENRPSENSSVQLNISASGFEETVEANLPSMEESRSVLINQTESDSNISFVVPIHSVENELKQNNSEITPFSVHGVSIDGDLMQQVELLRIVLQTVCCELAAANIDDGSSPLLLPLWMDVISAQELQLRLKSTINSLTAAYRPTEPTESIPVSSDEPSEWIEEIPAMESLCHEDPPFGLESPVITHMLSTWTSDENKVTNKHYNE